MGILGDCGKKSILGRAPAPFRVLLVLHLPRENGVGARSPLWVCCVGESTMFTVTEEWITRYASDKGGWTRQQLKLLGVDWPPIRGWKYRCVGLKISDEARQRFEEIGRSRRADLFGD